MSRERIIKGLAWTTVFVAVVGAIGCASSSSAPRNAKKNSVETAGTSDCRATISEAVRLHNAAVQASEVSRWDAALRYIDLSIAEWQKVTDGALTCDSNTVTYANDRLQRAMDERNVLSRSTR